MKFRTLAEAFALYIAIPNPHRPMHDYSDWPNPATYSPLGVS